RLRALAVEGRRQGREVRQRRPADDSRACERRSSSWKTHSGALVESALAVRAITERWANPISPTTIACAHFAIRGSCSPTLMESYAAPLFILQLCRIHSPAVGASRRSAVSLSLNWADSRAASFENARLRRSRTSPTRLSLPG